MYRKLLLLLVAILFAGNAGAQDEYFNTSVGNTLKWVIRDGDGKLFGYCHETLDSMSGNMVDGTVKYSYMFYNASGKSVIGKKPFSFEVTVSDGNTRAYVNDVRKALKSGDYMYVGDMSSIPTDIYVGMELRDTEIKVKVLEVFNTTNRYTARIVTDRQTIEVEAGTFDCFLVEDDEYFSGSGPFHVKTWVAKGIGMVKQEIRNKKGVVTQTFELIK